MHQCTSQHIASDQIPSGKTKTLQPKTAFYSSLFYVRIKKTKDERGAQLNISLESHDDTISNTPPFKTSISSLNL